MRLFKRCGCGADRDLDERKRLWRRCEHSYYYAYKWRGEKQKGCTFTGDYTAAAQEARRRRVEVEQRAGPGGRRRSGCTLEILEALDLRRASDRGYRPARARDLEGLWKPIYRHLGGPDREVMTITESELDGYQGKRRQESNGRGETVRGQTIRREVQALRRAVRLAVRDRLIPRSPVDWDLLESIDSDPPDERQASKRWAPAEVRKVLSHLSAKALRNGILEMLRFTELTGLRITEVARYERDTWLRGSELHVPPHGTKTRRGARVIHLTSEALQLAKKWERFSVKKPNKALQLASKKAGFDKTLTPRDLRGHRITKWASSNLMAAQRLSGHANIATTSRYLHPDDAAIRRTALAGERRPRKKGAQQRGPKKQAPRKTSVKSTRARSSAG